MKNRHKILQTLSAMVQGAQQPTNYQCIPREIILRSSLDWAEIYTSLVMLQNEGFVTIIDADGIRFSITQKGLDFADTMEHDSSMNILGYRSII
jgi:predicted transcriptional regulator